MDGYQATAEVRRLESGSSRHTPIVALTANALPDQLQRCLESGMDDHLTKPIDAARLQQIIDRYRPTAAHRLQPIASTLAGASREAAGGSTSR
jgi:CheY-like chemotaxis protein